MKINTKIKETMVYEVNGKEFLNESDAKSFRKQLIKLNKMKYFSIIHGFDATEGRGYYSQTFLKILVPERLYGVSAKDLAYLFCEKKIGNKIQRWYNDSIYINWKINEIEDLGQYTELFKRAKSSSKRIKEYTIAEEDLENQEILRIKELLNN